MRTRKGAGGCGCLFTLIIIVIGILPVIFAGWLMTGDNSDAFISKLDSFVSELEEGAEGVDVEVTQVQKDVVNKLILSIKNNDYKAFKEIASKDIEKQSKFFNDNKMKKSEIFEKLVKDFSEYFGSDYTLVPQNYTGKQVDLVVVEGTIIGCIGVADSEKNAGLFTLGTMLVEEKGEWKVIYAELATEDESEILNPSTKPTLPNDLNVPQLNEDYSKINPEIKGDPLPEENTTEAPKLQESVKELNAKQKEAINTYIASVENNDYNAYEKTVTNLEKTMLSAEGATIQDSFNATIDEYKSKYGENINIEIKNADMYEVSEDIKNEIKDGYDDPSSGEHINVDVVAVNAFVHITGSTKEEYAYIVFSLVSENDKWGVLYTEITPTSEILS